MRPRLCVIALLCTLLAPALQGCLLTRVLETRAQLCSEQPTRVLVIQPAGGGLRVVFEKPTLTDRDVVWIVGYAPTEIADASRDRKFFYEALLMPHRHDRATNLVVRLSFTQLEGEYKLAEVEIPEKFNSMLTPPLLEAIVRVVCTSQIGIVPPSTTFDLAYLDKATLPARDELIQLLGTPTSMVARSNEISYQYCLAPCDSKSPMVADLKFAFDRSGDLLRFDAKYFRYLFAVDLDSSKAIATIELN